MRLILVIVLLALSLGIAPLFYVDIHQATADLIETADNFTSGSTSQGTHTLQDVDNDVTFSELVMDGSATTLASSYFCGFDSGGDDYTWDWLSRGTVQWDISSGNFTDTSLWTSVKIFAYTTEVTNTFATEKYFAFYTMPTEPSVGYYAQMALADYDEMRAGTAVTEPYGSDDYVVTTWYEFEIDEEYWDDIIVDDMETVALVLRSVNDYVGTPPTWEEDKTFRLKFQFGSKLEISYLETPPDRVMDADDNAPTDNETTGYETADNITWLSPRCAYNDETLIVQVSGDSGAELDLQVIDIHGSAIIPGYSDSVRTDDAYRYFFTVPGDYEGFLKVVDTENNIATDWGYVSEFDNSQELGYVYAETTKFPQYYEDFPDYSHFNGEMFVVHFKTGISTDDFDIASFRAWYLGDDAEEVYNETFEDLVDDYWEVGEEDNERNCAWRFALFAFNDSSVSWDDRDGLIQELDQDYSDATSGWYQFIIYDDDLSEEATTTHSAEWFLQDAEDDGLIITTNKLNYDSGEDIRVTVYVGDRSHILDSLADISVDVYTDDDVWVNGGTDTLYYNNTVYEVGAPAFGTGYVQVQLYDTSEHSYTYTYRIWISVGEGEDGGEYPGGTSPSGLIQQIFDWVGDLGLGEGGGYLVTIIAMVLTFALLYSSAVLRVAVPMIILTVALVIGWVDPWVYIPLVLGFGFVLFMVFKKKTSGGVSSE